ncbi:hypothetical protein MJO28_004106 [Puccinia striiformis f. sp. tritici]|uniref:Uncharacterized protein n=4 Tax=Puccinia striiformis TaxID=27350 RepID=A0A0L0VPD6_9BASI|nr:hypothetical protein MJO28_004106 [Puccinia striiformis f. sp. tritici]KNF01126.1 hypothetical protein PSTG_05754 [Puccinia striiformis f. sp. tritici PST-78]POW11987.1 hypothetical protein PSTT_04831 [Puccinia striiformis]POW20761.1 hypothetical protein PSHT_03177 [Puccinia striiformis]
MSSHYAKELPGAELDDHGTLIHPLLISEDSNPESWLIGVNLEGLSVKNPVDVGNYYEPSLQDLIDTFKKHPSDQTTNPRLRSKINTVLKELGLADEDHSDTQLMSLAQYARALSQICGLGKSETALTLVEQRNREIVYSASVAALSRFQDDRLKLFFRTMRKMMMPESLREQFASLHKT